MTDNKPCRIAKHYGSFSVADFNRLSCAYCYRLLNYVIPKSPIFFNTNNGYLTMDDQNITKTLDPTREDDRGQIKNTMTTLQFDKWLDCCKAAELCCSDVMMVEAQQKSIIEDKYNSSKSCVSIWDGWTCHSSTPAGQISKVKCPTHMIENTCNAILDNDNDYSTFECNENGEWFKNNYGEWVNYGRCSYTYLSRKELYINVNITTQSISLFFLILGLIIFFSYRQLRVNRITLHKHFFSSLILYSIAQIVWESAVMKPNLSSSYKFVNSNHPGCILLNLLVNYTRSTNYFWMFCESLYLHKLLVSVFREDSNLFLFYFIGWGIYNEQKTINIPLFQILVPHERSHAFMEPSCQRLLLDRFDRHNVYFYYSEYFDNFVPLFGLHLILSPFVLCESASYSKIHNLLNRLIESLQVTNLLKKSLVESKCFKVLIYDPDSPENKKRSTAVDYEYSDSGENLNMIGNPLKRLKRSLLRRAYPPREPQTNEYKMSISRYDQDTTAVESRI